MRRDELWKVGSDAHAIGDTLNRLRYSAPIVARGVVSIAIRKSESLTVCIIYSLAECPVGRTLSRRAFFLHATVNVQWRRYVTYAEVGI